eukprot:scaffold7584_cov315-Pinguiococcus_pyrenoidosus.AAC.1
MRLMNQDEAIPTERSLLAFCCRIQARLFLDRYLFFLEAELLERQIILVCEGVLDQLLQEIKAKLKSLLNLSSEEHASVSRDALERTA